MLVQIPQRIAEPAQEFRQGAVLHLLVVGDDHLRMIHDGAQCQSAAAQVAVAVDEEELGVETVQLAQGMGADQHKATAGHFHAGGCADVGIRQGVFLPPGLEGAAQVLEGAAQHVAHGGCAAGLGLHVAVNVQHLGGEDDALLVALHIGDHVGEQMLVKGDVRVADEVILAAQVGDDKVVSAAKAAVCPQGIILHTGALPLQVHAKRACGGIVHHMKL